MVRRKFEVELDDNIGNWSCEELNTLMFEGMRIVRELDWHD